jgi:hypothetical protein
MLQQVMRMAMNMLVSKGIDAASRGGKDAGDMTPQERGSAQAKRQNMGRVRQAANMLRRFMR